MAVIKSVDTRYAGVPEYYTGNKYTFQGERYAVWGERSRAKQYSSRARAENAALALRRECNYCQALEIED